MSFNGRQRRTTQKIIGALPMLLCAIVDVIAQPVRAATDASGDSSQHRRPRLGIYAGIVFDMHANAGLVTESQHGIKTIDIAGLGYRAGVQTAFELGELWDVLPHLGFASWSAAGSLADVPARARVRRLDGSSADTIVPVDVGVSIVYRMIEVGMLFEHLVRSSDTASTLSLGVGPAVSVIIGSRQTEAFEMGNGEGITFAEQEGRQLENNGTRIVYWNDEINRRAFVRMSALAAVSVTRQLNDRASLRGSLAFNIPLTSVVELTSWRAFGTSVSIGMQWRLLEAEVPTPTIDQ
ncbi:MAG: hypothetical protein H7X80_05195 [bacterium]|nr:hypothetical protein [Candidatus Kapabacteria bacterium]